MDLAAMQTYPFTLQALLAELQGEIRAACPQVKVRITYAPFQNIDAFVEVTTDDQTLPPPLKALMEARFHVAEEEGYTIAVLLRGPVPARPETVWTADEGGWTTDNVL